MSDIIIGTAGHIDHGKTTLIKSLTGIQTDTTKEEQKRGLSINLGFAYLDLVNGKRVGIVDVPGHEKFIKNMVAGLPGIDLILLVIDCSEGVMEQTREHVDILSLLGVKNYIIVLSKCSSVDEDLKKLVVEDIKDQLPEYIINNSPIVETDALENIGIDKLKIEIQNKIENLADKQNSKNGRLNIDRSFSVKGFGTVVTGTLIDGEFRVGDELIVYPTLKKTKIRSIQVHDEDKKEAKVGQRTALNLSNISKEEVSRGHVLTNGEILDLSWMLDTKIKCLNNFGKGIMLWDRVRILIGTREIFARVVPIGCDSIHPGEEGFVQLRLEEEVAVREGDRFIIRAYSPMVTIGGGQVLDAKASKHKRFKEEVVNSLKIKEEGSTEQLLVDFLLNQEKSVIEIKDIENYLSLSKDTVMSLLNSLENEEEVIKLSDNEWIHEKKLQSISKTISNELMNYYKIYRLRKGMPIEEFRSKLKDLLHPKQLEKVISILVDRKIIIREEHIVGLYGYKIELNNYQKKTIQDIEKILKKAQFNPVKKTELEAIDEKNASDVLEYLENNSVVSLTYEYVIGKEYYEKSVNMIEEYIKKNGPMTLANFRDMTQSSRKSSMLILEYIDSKNITKRIENTRVLVQS